MRVEPDGVEHVEQHRDLDAVAGRERQPLEQRAARRDLAGERLAHSRQRGIEDRQGRPGEQVVDATAAVREHDVALLERPAVVRP